MSITKQQAALLYGNGYKLQDKEDGFILDIKGVKNEALIVGADGFRDSSLQLDRIGTDHFILARPLSDLTKPITHEGKEITPIIYMAILLYRKIFKYRDNEEFFINEYTIQDVNFGQMLKFVTDGSIYKFVCELDTEAQRLGFYLIRDNDIRYYLNQQRLFNLLYEWNFACIEGVPQEYYTNI